MQLSSSKRANLKQHVITMMQLCFYVVYLKAITPVPGCSKHLSLTSSLRGQLVKCFTTLLLNTLIFFVEKMREAAKASHIFQQKILAHFRY